MSFIVRVVGPSGMERYLSADWREVEHTKDAKHYERIDDAERDASLYHDVARKCWPQPPYVGVMDMNDD